MSSKTDIKIGNLSYVIAYVKDPAKSVPFYRDTLGLKVKLNEEGWVEMDTGSCTLALHHDDKMPANFKHEHAPCIVFGVENIQAAYDALKSKGVKFHGEPKTVCETPDGHVGRSAEFTDPDGNSLSIFGMSKK